MTNSVTPAIENVKAETAVIRLSVNMTLASIPVIITGQYNIDSNCYYPSTVIVETDLLDEYDKDERVDLEDFSEAMGWNHFDTYDLIQAAVENRDR